MQSRTSSFGTAGGVMPSGRPAGSSIHFNRLADAPGLDTYVRTTASLLSGFQKWKLRGIEDYPVLDEGLLPVPGGHQVFFKASGNRRGIPFLFIHGGPGAGSTDRDQLYFNASRDLVVRFDQRGCGQSVPYAGLENNDTWALVDDMEVIRKRLGIERWILFGGSWGTTLAKAYYLKHKAWPGSQRIVVPKAGHSATEPGIRGALVEAVDRHAALWLATHQ